MTSSWEPTGLLHPLDMQWITGYMSVQIPILQQAAAKFPWFHNYVLIDKVKSSEERLWYKQEAIANGWSRNVLVMQIEGGLYRPSRQSGNEFRPDTPRSTI